MNAPPRTADSIATRVASDAPPPSPVPIGKGATIRAWALRRKRLLVALGLLLLLLGTLRLGLSGASEGTPERSLAAVLARRAIRVTEGTVVWLAGDGGPWTLRPALFLGHTEGELDDVFYAEIRPGSGGAILDVSSVTNLTHSSSAAEEQLVRAGDHAAFVSRAGDAVEAVTILDLRGEGERAVRELTRVQRLQHAITNLQETGRAPGFGRIRYHLARASDAATLAVSGDRFALSTEDGAIVIDPAAPEAPIEGGDRVEVQIADAGVPGGITWIVDTVRNLSFVGPEPIEWLENRVFAVEDFFERTQYALVGSEDTEEAVAADLGATLDETLEQMTEERRALLTAQEAELGFPPPPMAPHITEGDPVEGEGEWIPVIDDPFVNQYPGAPPAFAQGFIRPDRERPYVRVYVTMWDPRQVQLRIMPGTREPESATGEVGAGQIPRDDRTLRRLVAAFNGGFQAMHGEFGMMADRRVYIPPKPWAATVAVFEDGHVGMGSWPAPNWRGAYFDERLANRQIPEGMVEMRQNLTSMVEDGEWNPWGRWWWGAAPEESEEQTFTYRSGMCLTTEGFMAFFWGHSLGPEALGQAMLSARCARSMHLDMNSGHCGFEFFRPYHPHDEATTPPPVDRVRGEYQHDDRMPGMRDWRVRARKAVRSMAMRFPRYTARDPRDFFFLTLRPVLPGPALDDGTALSTAGLPHRGWPYPLARAHTGQTWIVRIDPRRAVPRGIHGERHVTVLAGMTGEVQTAIDPGMSALYATRGPLGWELGVGVAGHEDRVLLAGAPLSSATGAGAAIAIDRDGFMVYAEGGDLAAALARAGARDAIALDPDVRLAMVGESGAAAPDGETSRALATEADLVFFAEEGEAAEVLFPDNTPIPYRDWGFLQGQRVRYFPDHPPRFIRDAGTGSH
jgi:hypothetical protein